jgi:flavin reductase (DIM6/NTAB) family NADH-FMN oxidoreductase RutF
MCLKNPDLVSGLQVFCRGISSNSDIEVTSHHLLLGYKPLIIGLVFSSANSNFDGIPKTLVLDFIYEQSGVATLNLRVKSIQNYGGNTLIITEGFKGHHNFLGHLTQYINRVYELFKGLKNGNVYLPGNLYEQVRIGYSIPRQIALITVSKNNAFNIFPTDLHGEVNHEFYVSSLRIGGMACHQVESAGCCSLSLVAFHWSKEVYSLGRNHMKELSPKLSVQLHKELTSVLKLPMPEAVVKNYELKVVSTMDIGMHRIFIYKIRTQKIFDERVAPLTHIHRYYAQWREDNNLPTEYILH